MSKKRKKKAAKPQRKRARARKADAGLRAIETALAALAHDIRTPLTGILAHAELLAASELGARERGWALGVRSAAEHLAQMTTIVCDAVRSDAVGLSLRQEPFSPRQLANDLAASLSGRAQTGGLKALVEISSALPDIAIGDAVRLRGAVENLIDNAVKFTARGAVTLRVSSKKAVRGKMQLIFTVLDSGIGLKPSEVKKLFRPFAQASEEVSRRYGGSGLGLMLVRRLARAMGGDLSVKSEPGKGSAFTLTALVVAPDAAGIEGRARNAGDAQRARTPRRILCVEDNPFGRVVLNTMLREFGDEADFVSSADAALDALKRERYDLVLMDVVLTGADGFETTRRIRKLPAPLGRIPVIGLSARANSDDQARDAGMNAFLHKPVSPADLADAIAKLHSPK
jgi:CheY-like chemotaxis protein